MELTLDGAYINQSALNKLRVQISLLEVLLIICGCYIVSSVFVTGRVLFPIQGITGQKIYVTDDQFNAGLTGGIVNNNIFLAVEDRPAIVVTFNDSLPIQTIQLNITGLSVSATNAQIYYASTGKQFAGERHIDLRLTNGENNAYLYAVENIDKLRIDLTDKKGVYMDHPHIFVYTYDSRASKVWSCFIGFFLMSIVLYLANKQ